MGGTVPTYRVLGFGYNIYAVPGTGDWKRGGISLRVTMILKPEITVITLSAPFHPHQPAHPPRYSSQGRQLCGPYVCFSLPPTPDGKHEDPSRLGCRPAFLYYLGGREV